jgi:hypothetical protein
MVRFFNTSEKDWDSEPYMQKEHSVHSECGKYLATVVVIPMPKKKKNGEDSTVFIPMGVRIEHIAGRKQMGDYVLPGATTFIKKKDQRVSQCSPWTFRTIGGELSKDSSGRPRLNPPEKHSDDYTRHISEFKTDWLNVLQQRAYERYEAHRAEKRAA